jgi:soluble lytic murein transglycosylase
LTSWRDDERAVVAAVSATRTAKPRPPGRPGAAARHREQARRRRRRARWLAGIGVVIVALIVARPLFQRAIQHLSLPLQYQSIIRTEATAEHLDPALIAAVIYAETRFDPRTSPTGAEGLMQIEPATAQFLAHRSGATTFTTADLWHPAVNIAYGSYYLRYLFDEFGGSKMLALAAYNGGETNAARWLQSSGGSVRAFTVQDIPFPQTRAYVEKVISAQRDYRQTYPAQLGYS